MKNDVLLKKLENINLLETNELLANLIEEIKLEMFTEENKGLTTKQRINYCMNYHKKLDKKPKKVLAYTCNDQIEGKQVFTDSFFMVVLSNDDKLPIPDYKDIKGMKLNYPAVVNLIRHNNYSERYKTFTCNVGKLLQYLKTEENLILKNNNDFNVALTYENFRNLITFMNFKNSDTITLHARALENTTETTSVSPVYVKKENGTEGIMLPVRVVGDYKTITDKDLA